MPVYEFLCEGCGRHFDVVATLAEFDAGLAPVCPKCRGRKCRQVIGPPTLLTGSKSESDLDDEFGDDSFDDESGLDDDYGTDDLNGDEGLDDIET